MLGDDVHEERNVHIHQRAGLYTVNILALFIIGGGVYDLARGATEARTPFSASSAG